MNDHENDDVQAGEIRWEHDPSRPLAADDGAVGPDGFIHKYSLASILRDEAAEMGDEPCDQPSRALCCIMANQAEAAGHNTREEASAYHTWLAARLIELAARGDLGPPVQDVPPAS